MRCYRITLVAVFIIVWLITVSARETKVNAEREVPARWSTAIAQERYAPAPAPEVTAPVTVTTAASTTTSSAPPQTTTTHTHAPIPSVWDAVAECESGGDWAANTGNGYYGGCSSTRTPGAGQGVLVFRTSTGGRSRSSERRSGSS